MNSAKTKTNQDHDHVHEILSPCHQPDKLIETDVSIPILARVKISSIAIGFNLIVDSIFYILDGKSELIPT